MNLAFIDAIRSFFRRTFLREQPFVFNPGRIGPRFDWVDHETIRLREGSLAGRELRLATEILPDKASVFARLDGQQIGRAYIERDPPGKGVVLWDIAVKEGFRRKGIASIMTYVGFRELLSIQETATFRIRMMRLMKPAERNVELQNVGIGVIGNRLGFTPEFDLDRLLRPENIVGIEILPAKDDFPPSFKVVIRTFPLVLIAFVLDPDTLKPVDDFRTYVKLTKDETTIYNWVRRGLIVIGNGNYQLRRNGLDQFVNHLATDEYEARVFRRRVRGV
uniref:GNAT family N-acetyltransferase n=1 Tax=candidate division WOR-3 bacterium TaxID=2052148 RepID=A0A7C4GFL0_UNCW3